MDTDPDPAFFLIDLQDANKNYLFVQKFFCLLLFEVEFTSFLKIKSQKEVIYYFCLVIEGFGAGSKSGSIPLTNGSGSSRFKTCGSGSGFATLTAAIILKLFTWNILVCN
jgi:hypothetical protein